METDRTYYPYPPGGGSGPQYYDIEQNVQGMLRVLLDKKQKLLHNLQTNPYQRNEIESQLRAVEREIQHYQQQIGPPDPLPPYPAFKGAMSAYQSPIDSAIGSGVTTKAPSVVAEDDLENFEDGVDTVGTPSAGPGFSYHQGYAEQQSRANEHLMQTRGDRIQMSMFPEAIQEREEVPSTQLMPSQQTNLQRLSQPAQILKAAIESLTSYQSSTEMTLQLLPEVAKLLTDVDLSVSSEAAKLLHELSKKEASCRALAMSGGVVGTTIQAMTGAIDVDTQKILAGTLHNLSNDKQGLLTIYKCGGIPYLVQLLTSQVDGILFYAITTLHNLLLQYEPAKMDVRLAGGLEKMVALLVKDNPKFLAITADCLHILAYSHQDSKLIILASGGPTLLVRIIRLYSYEKLLWTCCRLLKVLSVCPSNKSEIVQAGGMQALANHLSHRSTRLVQNVLFTLRNLSDAATTQDHLDDLLRQLILLMSSSDVATVTCCAGVLSNLTCNNAKNKTIVYQLHGVEALLRVISSAGGRVEIIEPAVCALRHITSRHPNAEMAQNSIRQQGGVPLVINLIQQQFHWPLIVALIGLIRNLALSTENHSLLHETIPKLWQYLNRAYQDSARRSTPGGPPGLVDGVYMDGVIEACVAALHLLARDSNNRVVMKQLNCIPLFVQLLYSSVENITRVAAGVLCELAQDPDGAVLIERENASTPLTELLHSRNEVVAAYAASVLFCLSEESRRPSVVSGVRTETTDMAPHTYYQGGGGGGGIAGVHSISASSTVHHSPHSTTPSTPHQAYLSPAVSGLVTPDLDLPLDLDVFDDFAGDGLTFTSPTPPHPHTPHYSGVMQQAPPPTHHPPHPTLSHTHHHHQQQQQQQQQQQHGYLQGMSHTTHHHPAAPPQGYTYHHSSYNPPSPAVMETAPGGRAWFDSDL